MVFLALMVEKILFLKTCSAVHYFLQTFKLPMQLGRTFARGGQPEEDEAMNAGRQ